MSTRRDFLGASLVGLTQKGRAIAGGFVNESHQLGHRLRDGRVSSSAKRTVRVPVVIVGGGIAGLSAAWRLHKRGFHDFVLLEMEKEAGGNSRSGENEISAYPWAAHYIPVPGYRLTLVRELMQDLGVLRDGVWDERMLCHSPQERVFVHGRWQEGFEPETREDRAEWARFEQRMEEFAGTGAFTIPVSETPKSLELDRLSMHEWLHQNGFHSKYLHWYVDYACRDDYGARASETSAWMGVHYFASRDHDEDRGPLTWPEGNGWIVRQMLRQLGRYVRTGEPVIRVRPGREVLTPGTLYKAQHVIWAAPSFLAQHIVEGAPAVAMLYSPWVTANLTLDRIPKNRGFEPAWDNVIVGSPSLGYVRATHMNLRTHEDRSVWTWYHATSDRRALLDSTWDHWRDFILSDLERAHPDIRECVARIDVMRMGHAMARPVTGGLTNPRPQPPRGIWLANSDLSGYSIFEEAQHRGVRAADAVLKMLP